MSSITDSSDGSTPRSFSHSTSASSLVDDNLDAVRGTKNRKSVSHKTHLISRKSLAENMPNEKKSLSEQGVEKVSVIEGEQQSASEEGIESPSAIGLRKVHSASEKKFSRRLSTYKMNSVNPLMRSVRSEYSAPILSPKNVQSPKYSPKSAAELNRSLRSIYIDLLNKLKSGSIDLSEKIKSKEMIYLKISRALGHEIYYFFDDSGRFITLSDLDKLVVKIYGLKDSEMQDEIRSDLNTLFANLHFEIPEESVLVENLWKCSLPNFKNEFGKIENKSTICLSILLRLYPLSSPLNVERIHDKKDFVVNSEKVPLFPPITLLCVYKEFVSTEDLFKNIAIIIESKSDWIPWYQKLRIMNFCRVWLESNLYITEKKSPAVQNGLKKIIQVGMAHDDNEMNKACNELQELLENSMKSTFLIQSSGSLQKVDLQADIHKWIDLIAADLSLISSEACLSLGVFVKNENDKTSVFFNKVTNYVVNSMTGGRRENFIHFADFFVSLSLYLYERNDFLSSFAIYSALHVYPIMDFLKSKDKKFKYNKLMRDQLKKLNEVYAIEDNYLLMRERVQECKRENIFYIPLPSLIKTKMLHLADSIELFGDEKNISIIDVEKFSEQASLSWALNQYFQDLRTQYIDKIQKETLQTTIMAELEKSTEIEEAALELFSKRMKE